MNAVTCDVSQPDDAGAQDLVGLIAGGGRGQAQRQCKQGNGKEACHDDVSKGGDEEVGGRCYLTTLSCVGTCAGVCGKMIFSRGAYCRVRCESSSRDFRSRCRMPPPRDSHARAAESGEVLRMDPRGKAELVVEVGTATGYSGLGSPALASWDRAGSSRSM